ncbi:MAG: hypothetical protein JSR83_22400 [Proteobacteria bacterium]|nr:hypothetical protein [Pseudomonadota bacterium]
MTREFRLILYFVIGVFFSAVSVLSFAGDRKPPIPTPAMDRCTSLSANTATYPIIVKACYYDSRGACPASKDGGTCTETAMWNYKLASNSPNEFLDYTTSTYNYCPDSAPKWNGTTCVQTDPCSAKSGQSVDDGSIDFGDGSNKKLSMSFPTRSDDNYVGQTFCSGGCKAAVDREVGSAGMTVDGSYYGQFSAKFSGQSCESGQAAATPKTTPALIPKNTPEYDCVSSGMGYGYVDNAVKCVAKTSSKASETKSTQTTNADGTRTTVNKTDSTVCASGVCTTTTTTTTTQYNSSGSATGTSITSETSTKPDPNSGLGSGGSGNGQQQGAECGVAGKPPCGVKVDETGVSSDVSAVDQSAKQKILEAYDEVRQKMEEVTRPQRWGVTWVYQPPAGACSALQYGTSLHKFSIDICKPLGYIRDLWSYVIYVMTGLYIWRSARDAMNIV